MERYVKVHIAAKAWQKSKWTIWRWCRGGLVATRKVGRTWQVDIEGDYPGKA